MSDFAEQVRATLAARLAPRRAEAHTSVLGAGSDDLDTGRAVDMPSGDQPDPWMPP